MKSRKKPQEAARRLFWNQRSKANVRVYRAVLCGSSCLWQEGHSRRDDVVFSCPLTRNAEYVLPVHDGAVKEANSKHAASRPA
eukprot:758426-Hanusia_phi.AAC.3